jgi:hypothetical protein
MSFKLNRLTANESFFVDVGMLPVETAKSEKQLDFSM